MYILCILYLLSTTDLLRIIPMHAWQYCKMLYFLLLLSFSHRLLWINNYNIINMTYTINDVS